MESALEGEEDGEVDTVDLLGDEEDGIVLFNWSKEVTVARSCMIMGGSQRLDEFLETRRVLLTRR